MHGEHLSHGKFSDVSTSCLVSVQKPGPEAMAKDLRGVHLSLETPTALVVHPWLLSIVIVPLAGSELKEAQVGAVCSLRSVSFTCFVNGHTIKTSK